MVGLVNKIIVPLKQFPDEKSITVDEVLYGWIVTMSEEYGAWVKVRTHYNYEGFANKKYFITGQRLVDTWYASDKYTVNNKSADILTEPKVQANIIKTLTLGCLVHKISNCQDLKGWCSVKLVNGETGYMRVKFLSPEVKDYSLTGEEDIRNNIVNTAKFYLGTQYRWGGKTPIGIDCSGLVFMSYLLNGAIIYRDAEIKIGFLVKQIDFKEIKKGDLIFFPGHVAMYIDNGEFIHSSESINGVGFNSFNPKLNNYREDLLNCILYVGSLFARKE